MKFKIALQVVKNDTPLNDIFNKYDVAPGKVHARNKLLLEHGAQVFNNTDKTAKLLTEHRRDQASIV